MNHYRIGIVGFGVAGASAALLLARAGHEVHLFERAPHVGPVGAGILLQPSGQIVLERMGLLEKAVQHSERIDELHAVTETGKTLIRLPYAELEPNCHAYGMHRGDLFEALLETVIAQKVNIHLGHEIKRRIVRYDQVFLRDTHGCEHGPFDFIVAGDGSRSSLRLGLNTGKWIHEYAYAAWWAIGSAQAVRHKLHQVVQGTTKLLGLLPMGGGRCSLFWGLRRGERDYLRRRGFPAWRDTVLRLCPLAEEVLHGIHDFDHFTFTTYQHVWLRSWHDRHCLIIGDAAHAMSPHLGQGVNFALLDAYTFAHQLERAKHFRDAFLAYTLTRQYHLRFYATITLALTPFFQSSGIIKGWARNIALPMMTSIPWVRRQMIQTMAGMKSGFFGGRLTVP